MSTDVTQGGSAASLPPLSRVPDWAVSMADVVPIAQRWVWDGMIPADTFTLVGGKGGSHKSTLMISLCARLSLGSLPGCYFGTPVTVAYLSAENDVNMGLAPKLLQAGADMTRVFTITRAFRFPDDTDELMRGLEHMQAKVLVIDPLMAYFEKLGSYSGSVKVLTTLLEACARRGVTLIGVHHVVKSSKKPNAQSLFGNAGLSTTVRQALLLGEANESKVVAVVKSNVGADRQGWTFTVTYGPLADYPTIDAPTVEVVRPAHSHEIDDMWEWTEDTDERVTTLLEIVEAAGAMTTRDAIGVLCREFAIKARTARNVISRAVAQGLLDRTVTGGGGNQVWTLTLAEPGRLLLTDGGDEVAA